MATCNICHAQYDWGDNPCKRCEQDNSFWEEQRELPRWERFTVFFGNVWGVITILLNILVFGLMVWVLFQRFVWGIEIDNATILGRSLAWFLSFIFTFVIYAARFQLWHYSWYRNILDPHPPSLLIIAVILFVSGVFLLLVYLSIVMFALPLPIHSKPYTTGQIIAILFVKIVLPAIYALVFTFLTTGSSFMSAALFVDRLNEKVAQPIYMNTKLLADIVEAAAVESLELPKDRIQPSAIKRTKPGGIEMIINYMKSDYDPDNPEDKPFIRRYEVAADRWGQIEKLNEVLKSSSK